MAEELYVHSGRRLQRTGQHRHRKCLFGEGIEEGAVAVIVGLEALGRMTVFLVVSGR